MGGGGDRGGHPAPRPRPGSEGGTPEMDAVPDTPQLRPTPSSAVRLTASQTPGDSLPVGGKHMLAGRRVPRSAQHCACPLGSFRLPPTSTLLSRVHGRKRKNRAHPAGFFTNQKVAGPGSTQGGLDSRPPALNTAPHGSLPIIHRTGADRPGPNPVSPQPKGTVIQPSAMP